MSIARMLPLHTLPAARFAPLRGVLTDIDDTLTRDAAIEPEALAALQRLADAGCPVIAITGRPLGWSEERATAWPLTAVVAENGAVLLRRDGGRWRREFAQDEATRSANAVRLRACADAVRRAVPGATPSQDSAGRVTDIAIDHAEHARLDAAQVERVVVVMRLHGLQASVSSIHVNGWIGEHGKWSGACWAVERALGEPLDPARWVYVGDSTNDQAMFERLPLSVGVANIARFVPSMQTLPAYVTRHERGRGFAEVAEAVLEARGM